ncbi:predicted protein, partial [Thalassiosira pseudonana CCMP1335]
MLQILHTSDMESDFQDTNTLEEKINLYSALTSGLYELAKAENASSIHVTAGDNTLPGPFYKAAAEVPSLGAPGLGDSSIFNALGINALGLGNHGFDGGADEFCGIVAYNEMPSLAVNLDFSNFVCAAGIVISEDAMECSTIGGSVAKSCYVDFGNMKVGLIGRAPAGFFEVVENPSEKLPGLDFVGGRDEATNQPLESATPMVLEQVDALTAAGCDVIVLLDHAQDWTTDAFTPDTLSGIDVIVQAGGTEFMVGTEDMMFNMLREGDSSNNVYPVSSTDMDGNTVLIIDTAQLWTYIGHLMVEFDDEGHIVGYDERSGPIATTEEAVTMFGEYVGTDITPINGVAETLAALQATDSITDGFTSIGTTEFVLEGTRENVRSRETNLCRVVADSSVWGAQKHLDDNGMAESVHIALKNGGGVRETIAGPEITRISIQAALAFDNKLAIVKVTVPQLLAIFENGLSRYPDYDGRFPQVSGMTIVFDPSQPGVESQTSLDSVSRIVDLMVGDDAVVEAGEVVADMDMTFVVATNSFLLTGGDGYAAFIEAESLAETSIGEQQILEEYIGGELGGKVDMDDPPV